MRTGRLKPDGANGAATESTGLNDVLGVRTFRNVVIPRTEVRGCMRMLTRSESARVRVEARAALQKAGFPIDASAIAALGGVDEWNAQIAVRSLALAIRDPLDVELALASVEEYEESCDEDQLGALWEEYKAHAAAIDPLRVDATISEDDFNQIRDAAKKKDVDLLMSFGSQKLASFAITSASQPATSATPTS